MAGRDLPADLIEGGASLLATTDALNMHAQGAMWVYDHLLDDWRFYLVTSLVDSLGRRKTYKLLLDAFETVSLPKSMTVEDVHLGSPRDPFFTLISSAISVTNGGRVPVQNCVINGLTFDGLIYRSVHEMPSDHKARSIEKRFSKRVKDIASV